MTAVIGGISVFLEDDTARFQQSMLRNATLVEQQSQRMTRSLGNTARSVDELNRRASSFQPDAFRALALSALRAETSIERLRSSIFAVTALATGGFAGAFAAKVVTDTADSYKNVQNRIAAVVQDEKARASVEQSIFDISQRTRSSYEATATLFQRLTLSSTALKASQEDILRVVELTQKALITAGATTQEAAGAAVQLSQALGSGRLAGDELRSILENAPILAQAIAAEFGVAVGDLKEMGSQGQLVSDRVFKAILRAGGDINDRFSNLKPTVASALVVLDNAFTRYVGQMDASLGATTALANGIIALSQNLHVLGDVASIVLPLFGAAFVARATGKGLGSVTAPYRQEFAKRDAALAQARAAEQVQGERVVGAGANLQNVRARARTDLESFADTDVVRDRDRVVKAVEADTAALKKAEDAFDQVAKRNVGTDLGAITRSAEQIRASGELKSMRSELREAQSTLREAETAAQGANLNAVKSVTSKTAAEQLDRGRAIRQQLLRGISEIDQRIGESQAQLDSLPEPRVGARSARRAQRVAELDAELKDLRERRNQLGLELRDVLQVETAGQDALNDANRRAKEKAAADAKRLGDSLVTAEAKVAEQRKVVADRNAKITGYRESGRAMSAEAVLTQIDNAIKAEERLDTLTKRRDAIGKGFLDAEERARNVGGSLKPDQVRDLNAARSASQSMLRDLDDLNRQIEQRQRQRDEDAARIGPRVAKNLVADAERQARQQALSESLVSDTTERERLRQQLTKTEATTGATEKRLQLQDALNDALAKEAAIAGPTDGSKAAQQERLNKVIRENATIQKMIVDLDAEAGAKMVATADDVSEAKRKVAMADRSIKDEVSSRLAAERGEANRGLMREVSDAAVGRSNAADGLRLSRDVLDASNAEVRQSALANATKEVGTAQRQTTIAAAGYARAQNDVAAAAARTGVATTLMSTTLRLAGAGFSSLVAFLGGPIGVAFTAASVGLSVYALQQAKAAEAVRQHAEALEKLAARSKEVQTNADRGSGLTDVEVLQYRQLQKGGFRSLNDQRDAIVSAGRKLQSQIIDRGSESAGYKALTATGIDTSQALVDLTTLPATSERSQQAILKIRDALVAVALVDPGFAKQADGAIDAADKYQKALDTVMAAQRAFKAGTEVKPQFASPLSDDLVRAPKFDGTTAAAAVAAYVEQIKSSITELTETRIEFPGLSTSRDQLADLATTMGQARAEAAGLISTKIVPRDLQDAVQAFAAGGMAVEDYAVKLQELKVANPAFAPLIDSLAQSVEKAIIARSTLQGLGIDISKLDGMVANVVIKVGVSGDPKEIAEGIAGEAAKAAKVVADLEAKTRNMRLRADGKSAEATTNEIMAATPAADRNRVMREVTEQEALQKRISGSKKKPAKSEDEKFEDRLQRLQEEGRAAFFSDVDRELIEELKKIKGEPVLLRNTVDAVKAGTALPEQAQRLKDALVMRDAGKEYREIVQQYGTAEQVLPRVNSEQEKLNLLLSSGKITQEQYGLALSDVLGKYQNFKYIDQLSDAIGNFGGELAEVGLGFKSLDDVSQSFIQTIARLGIQIAIIQPLINMLKSSLSAAAVGDNPLGVIGGFFGLGGGGGSGEPGLGSYLEGGSFAVLHEGGIAGRDGTRRTAPLSLLAGAPRFHGGNLGLGPDEIPAILQRGEPVLSRRTARNLSSAIGALSDMSGGGGQQLVNIHPPANTVPEVQRRRTPTGQSLDVMIRQVLGEDLGQNGELAQMLQGMYGLNRMAGKRT